MTRQRLAAALVAAAMLAVVPAVNAAAQSRIGLNGGRPSEWPILSSLLADAGLTQEGWLAFASHVGENWLPGMTPIPVDYPAQLGPVSGPSALTADQSIAVGQQNLHDTIMKELMKGEPVTVAALSMGTLVIDKEIAYLQTALDAPSATDVTFYVFGDPARGFGRMYMSGLTVPFVGLTFDPVPESQYNTVVVIEQWDGLANPPDRPWNLLADINALMGALYTVNGSNDHSRTALDSLAEAVQLSQTTNSRGATTTTYMIPRHQLPLTRPLLQLGVPSWVVDEIDSLLMPLIRAGYSALTPNLGPHVDNGQLLFTAAQAQPMSTADVAATDVPEPSTYTPPSGGVALDAVAPTHTQQTPSAVGLAAPVRNTPRGPADLQDIAAPATADAAPTSDVSRVTEPVEAQKKPVDTTSVKDAPKDLPEIVKDETVKVTAGSSTDTTDKTEAPAKDEAGTAAKAPSDSDGSGS